MSCRARPAAVLVTLAAAVVLAWPAYMDAQDQSGGEPATPGGPAAGSVPGTDPPDARGRIVGRVVDAVTGEPLAATRVRLRELGRQSQSDAAGVFRFEDVAPGRHTLVAERLGYAPVERRVEVRDSAHIAIEMQPTALELSGILVTGTGRERHGAEVYRPAAAVAAAELRRNLDLSVAATLAHLAGVSQRYNGPAASQPVIRGMGGDRVLVLEDGQRTGDLASTAADHAVAIDPMSALRMEVVRGPAALLYGSNALGGVINVIREEIPRTLPDRLTGEVTLKGASVNDEVGGGAYLLMPLGRVVVRGELTARTAGDTRTPLGILEATGIQGRDASLGASWVGWWGHAGLSFRDQTLDYGVPGEFGGQVIPGAHPSGVEAESRRHTGRFEAVHAAGAGPFNRIRLEGNIVHFTHDEIEGRVVVDGEERRLVGTQFDQLIGSGTFLAYHEHDNGPVGREGAVGLWGYGRDLEAGGRFTGTRPASEVAAAGFVFEEIRWSRLSLEVGARYDVRRVTPEITAPIRVDGREIAVRERTFGDWSGSVAALYDIRSGWRLGASVARAFRTPALEELFSDGPHLADFSFNIGDPALKSETGVGIDLFARLSRPTLEGELTVFRNQVRNYVHYAPTGELDPRFRRFPVFQARGDNARFSGAEATVQWEALPRTVLEGAATYVRATRLSDGDPLPAIPPLDGRVGARYDAGPFFAAVGWTGAVRQNRVPRPVGGPDGGEALILERPTAGYGLWNAALGLRLSHGMSLHTVTVRVENATDRVWRDHLSRVKDVAPQPGRNVQMLYRVQF